MQNCIEKTLYSGHASYKLSLSVRVPLDYLHSLFLIMIVILSLNHTYLFDEAFVYDLFCFFAYSFVLKTGYLDIWEPATLAIKRDGYSIKCNGPSRVVVTEKFSPSIIVCSPSIFVCSH